MKKRPKKSHWREVLRVGRFEVNLNTVLTTIFGSLACILLGWTVASLGVLTQNWSVIYREFPQVQKDVAKIVKEQERIKTQYAPPVPSPTP